MAGGEELQRLLAALAPRLLPGEFVFCAVPEEREAAVADLPALATFREAEGLSLVLERALAARNGLRRSPAMRCISLAVHSPLDAVGLTAAISSRLARQGISANVVAAYFHDHVFVPAARAEEALAALRELSRERGDSSAVARAVRKSE